MRNAMVGLGAGMLATIGLNTLFGNRQHNNQDQVATPDAQGTQEVQTTQEVVEENRGLDILYFIVFCFVFPTTPVIRGQFIYLFLFNIEFDSIKMELIW